MKRPALFAVFSLAIAALTACGTNDRGTTTPATAATDTPAARLPGPFHQLPVRYDGYYMAAREGVMYLVRFFPEGNAVLINGMGTDPGDLPAKLVRDAVPDPLIGHYNVLVDVAGDSLFFTTTPRRGEIDHRGTFADAHTLRLERHSRITGHRMQLDYQFVQD